MTVAGGDEFLRGFWSIAAVTAETENNSGTVDAYPANWHSDAFWPPDLAA